MNRLLTYVRRHHLGLLALFIALGGTSYAAVKLPNNSVGSAQIKAGAVGSREVRNGSLTAKDFKKGTVAQGATGAQGPKGETGATGPQGPAGKIETIAVRLEQSGTQDIAKNPGGQDPTGTALATTPVTFSTAAYDTSGFFDATRTVPDFMGIPIASGDQVVRIPKDGIYSVNGGVRWAAATDGVRNLAILTYAAGGTSPPSVIAQNTSPANLVGSTAQNVSTTDRLKEGDFVLLGVGQNSTTDPLQLKGSQKQIHLAVTYLGP